MARTNKSQFAILGFLSNRPMSAYEIKQTISKSVSYFWSEGEGQLYPTLKNLATQQFVTYQETPAKKGGTKKVYTITKQGKSALLDWLGKKCDRPVYRNELLLKLFFGAVQSTAHNIARLEVAQQACESSLEVLKLIKASLPNKPISAKRLPYVEITLDYGIESWKAELRWCQRSIKKLRDAHHAA